MSGLREITEASMLTAYAAGMDYWNRNTPANATQVNLASLARSCGWHDEDNAAWLAGFYAAKSQFRFR